MHSETLGCLSSVYKSPSTPSPEEQREEDRQVLRDYLDSMTHSRLRVEKANPVFTFSNGSLDECSKVKTGNKQFI